MPRRGDVEGYRVFKPLPQRGKERARQTLRRRLPLHRGKRPPDAPRFPPAKMKRLSVLPAVGQARWARPVTRMMN